MTLTTYLFEALILPGHKYRPNSRLGSNPGGVYEDTQGKKSYIKFYPNPDQAKMEAASAKITKMLGVNVVEPEVIQHQGQTGLKSPWVEGLHKAEWNDKDHETLAKLYHASVLTKNWDIIGLERDNTLRHSGTKELWSLDHGGAFSYRAMGGAKPYTTDVGEFHSMKNNPQESGKAFGKLPREAELKALDSVKALDYNTVHKVFQDVGLSNHKELMDTFWRRRDSLIKQYE